MVVLRLQTAGLPIQGPQAPLQDHLETEADKAKAWWCCNFKARVCTYKVLKDLCEPHVMADVVLEALKTHTSA